MFVLKNFEGKKEFLNISPIKVPCIFLFKKKNPFTFLKREIKFKFKVFLILNNILEDLKLFSDFNKLKVLFDLLVKIKLFFFFFFK